MENPIVTFNESGFTVDGVHIPWTTETLDTTHPPIAQLIVNLNTAQSKWDFYHRGNFDFFVDDGEVILHLLEAKTDRERVRIRLGRHCSKIFQSTYATILESMMLCMADAQTDEFMDDFAFRVASNTDIVHFLSVLEPKYIHLSLAALEYYPDCAPMLVQPADEITEQQLSGHDWSVDPFKTPLKVRFDRTVGKLVSLNV